MKLTITSNPRLSEPIGFVLLAAAIAAALSLVSYHPLDPSLDVAGADERARNLIGLPGAYFSDSALQWLGVAAFLIPAFLATAAWLRLKSAPAERLPERLVGSALLLMTCCAVLGLAREWRLFHGAIQAGGVVGSVLAEALVGYLNRPGAVLALLSGAVVSLYLLTSFELRAAAIWLRKHGDRLRERTSGWRLRWRRTAPTKPDSSTSALVQASPKAGRTAGVVETAASAANAELQAETIGDLSDSPSSSLPPIVPYEDPTAEDREIATPFERPDPAVREEDLELAGEGVDDDEDDAEPQIEYRIPTTSLLQGPSARVAYDPEQLHETARRIAKRFEEFKVGGSVVQINPGPVVTTFEFKPDPGVKYSKIVNLSEDLCLALECESILVERIPGKSTIGIEVPNRRREIITLREVIESRDFREAESPLTVAMGKDINGKLQVADLCSMPHLLVAGSTGSGKSVMINAFVMSVLLRATPEQVRFIMIDPKTVELGLYADIPHLLTPVITDMKKASNALKNATREMERRLKLLAEHAVRNIDQYNSKIERMRERLAGENPDLARSLKRLPYILIIIDELADLMMLEGRQIEESVTRLAQMARAVGIHLVLATQRPSVDVITGLIKANVPARISFRLATRVDSRTILDTMGAEALLGRGDMLFLPPGTARMKRLHGPFVTEEEIEAVVNEWKRQGRPQYETEYLESPQEEDEDSQTADDDSGFDDPMYREAVTIVLQMGKASTSTLQRRLRLGYGRAARILDAMEREGIIGPPDGSRPREVLKRPDWLDELQE